jgi:hypothetical protein
MAAVGRLSSAACTEKRLCENVYGLGARHAESPIDHEEPDAAGAQSARLLMVGNDVAFEAGESQVDHAAARAVSVDAPNSCACSSADSECVIP